MSKKKKPFMKVRLYEEESGSLITQLNLSKRDAYKIINEFIRNELVRLTNEHSKEIIPTSE